jgi:hypothetical protein
MAKLKPLVEAIETIEGWTARTSEKQAELVKQGGGSNSCSRPGRGRADTAGPAERGSGAPAVTSAKRRRQ